MSLLDVITKGFQVQNIIESQHYKMFYKMLSYHQVLFYVVVAACTATP